MRLLELGVPYFLLQATLVGVLAQRLVRKNCRYCEETFQIEADELIALGLDVGRTGPIELVRGKGCEKCRGTGFMGRTCILEMMPFSESIRKMTGADIDVDALRAKAREEGMRTLRECAIEKMLKGITTYQEVMRVTWEQR
jgi:general secretion pathway protein E